MAGLLVVFILASVVLILQVIEEQAVLEKKQTEVEETREELTEAKARYESTKEQLQEALAQLRKAEEVRRTVVEELVQKLAERGINVRISENASVVSIPNELLGFGSGRDEILPRYQETARDIGRVLHEVVSHGDRFRYLDTVFIEGHTDPRPFDGAQCAGKGNWCLSTFRAISLWRFWEDALPSDSQLDELRNPDGKPLFSVSGYADSRPPGSLNVISHQDDLTDEQLAQFRRINIRFTVSRPESEEVETFAEERGESQ
ncbi:hypothetical protein LV476_04750 [Guyparkeria hydrothermalis]|uniref:hypothetical protein n=1 Tax=Guyparkeria hydrothermalis TaxID=923 RepID=UPI002021D3D6|nr:hypothetical protein [Guyparkeria hydrothermalis]MCL7744260.1 hypothetical protein [Guyparkeria hydrothermalis]